VPSPRTEVPIDKGTDAKPQLSPQPESPKETPLEPSAEPIVIDFDPPAPGAVKDDSTQGFVLVPRNPFTHPESLRDSESRSDSAAKDACPFGKRAPSPSRAPPTSSGTKVDPNAQRLWDVIRGSGLNPEAQTQKLVEIDRRLQTQHEELLVSLYF
jgi:hypothetical protein